MPYENMDDRESEKKPKKKFRLFDTQREGKGVKKEDVYTKKDLKGFFISLKLHFSQLIPLNFLILIGNFPVFFLLAGLSDLFRDFYFRPSNVLYTNFAGLLLDNSGASGLTSALRSLFSVPIENSVMTTGNFVFIGLSALIIFTIGIVSVGVTYVLREIARGNPVFLLEDFFHAIKNNWKQALPFGILDGIMLLLIPFNLYYFFVQNSFFSGFLLWIMIVITYLYLSMRHYVYLEIITFDLPLMKILKNALIMSIYNFKRNILAFLGGLVLVVLNFLCFFTTITVPLGIALPLLFFFSLTSYMGIYAAYFYMEKIMVDTSAEESNVESANEDLPDPE